MAGHDGRAFLVAILDNLQEIAFSQALKYLWVAAVASCQGERGEEPWHAVMVLMMPSTMAGMVRLRCLLFFRK